MDSSTLQSVFQNTKSHDWKRAENFFSQSVVSQLDIGDSSIESTLVINNTIVKTTFSDINQDRIEVNCSCYKYDMQHLCIHMIISWMEFENEGLNLTLLFNYTDIEYFKAIDPLNDLYEILEEENHIRSDLKDLFLPILIHDKSEKIDVNDTLNDLLRDFITKDAYFMRKESFKSENQYQDFKIDLEKNFLIKYHPRKYFTKFVPQISKSRHSLLSSYFEELEPSAVFSYFLLISSNPIKEVYFQHTNKKIQLALDPTAEIFQTSDFDYIKSQNDYLKITDPEIVRFLINEYDTLRLRIEDQLLENLNPKKRKHSPIALLNFVIMVLEDAKTVFTTDGLVYKSVLKSLQKNIDKYLPKKYTDTQQLYIIEFLIFVATTTGLVTEKSDRSVSFSMNYSKFLNQPEDEQITYIATRLIEGMNYPYFSNSPRQSQPNITWYIKYIFDYLTGYLNSLEGETRRILFKPFILLDIYKRKLELKEEYPDYKEFDGNTWKPLELNEQEYRPQNDVFRAPTTSTIYDGLFNYIEVMFDLIGVITPMVDSDGNILAYNFSKPEIRAETDDAKHQEMPKRDIYVLPDFTIKGSKTSFSPDEIEWILHYTQVINLDKMIETKLTKQKLWNFLNRNYYSGSKFIDQLDSLTVNEIPQNVKETIKNWSSQFGFAQVIEGTPIQIDEPEVVNDILELEELEFRKIIRLTSTVIVVPEDCVSIIVKYIEKSGFHVKIIKTTII